MNERLLALRRGRGWTQAEAGAHCRVSRQHYSQIETGLHRPSVAAALKIARAFGVPVETVFGDPDEPDRPASGE